MLQSYRSVQQEGSMSNRSGVVWAGIVALATVTTALPALAQEIRSWSCERLWQERNQIYKDAGYCFKTARAIRYFGNSGCSYDREGDVPLSQRDREFVATIQQVERSKGCQ
jgi:hypothetical protein